MEGGMKGDMKGDMNGDMKGYIEGVILSHYYSLSSLVGCLLHASCLKVMGWGRTMS